MVRLNRPSPKTPGRPKHLSSICHTNLLIGDFVQILGVRGPKSKIEENSFVVPHGEQMAKKWLDSIEKQKRINLKERASGSGQTDTVNC